MVGKDKERVELLTFLGSFPKPAEQFFSFVLIICIRCKTGTANSTRLMMLAVSTETDTSKQQAWRTVALDRPSTAWTTEEGQQGSAY